MSYLRRSRQTIIWPFLVHEYIELTDTKKAYKQYKAMVSWCEHELLTVEFHDTFVKDAVQICIVKNYQRRTPKTRPLPTKPNTRFVNKLHVQSMRWSRKLRAWYSRDGHWYFPVWVTISKIES